MGIIVNTTKTIHTPTLVITEGVEGVDYTKVNNYDKTIYRTLSMLSSQYQLPTNTIPRTELDIFIKHAELYYNNQAVPVGFTSLNNYLGSLGV